MFECIHSKSSSVDVLYMGKGKNRRIYIFPVQINSLHFVFRVALNIVTIFYYAQCAESY